MKNVEAETETWKTGEMLNRKVAHSLLLSLRLHSASVMTFCQFLRLPVMLRIKKDYRTEFDVSIAVDVLAGMTLSTEYMATSHSSRSEARITHRLPVDLGSMQRS